MFSNHRLRIPSQYVACLLLSLPLVLASCGVGRLRPSGEEVPDYAAGRRAYAAGDYQKAFKIWEPLARQGDNGAQFFVGFLYETGQGVQKNPSEAVKWLSLSADQGMGDAQVRLSRLLYLGLGAPPDRVQAYKWAELSSELGNGDARKVLTELKPIMSEAEVGEGKRLVEEWKTRHAKASLTVNDNDGAPPNIPALSGRRPH